MLDGMWLSLDFEKLFDSVEYYFLFKILEKFNISNNFIGQYTLCKTNI